jgi:hypothetical protein
MMTKNAITAIGQELIDDVCFALANKVKPTACKIKSLAEMAKDLIEINAELTKREQKYKMAMNDQIRFNSANSNDDRSYMYLEQVLKCE